MNRFVPTLTDAQFAAMPLSERLPLVCAYLCDVEKVKERIQHDNHGPEIDAWCRILDEGNGGIPWCGVFVSIALRLAGYWGELPPDPASTHSWAAWARAKGYALPLGQEPERGDVFVLLFTPSTGHMGVVAHPAGDGDATIEGNTNLDGSRDGYEVARHVRKLVASASVVLVRIPEREK